MSNRTIKVDDRLYDYVLRASLRELPLLARLREETASHPSARMQISPEQGQLMGLLVELVGAKRTIEVGVFTGYSSLVTALALPPDGKILACDVSEEFTSTARRYWKEARVDDKIELVLAPATETLDARIRSGESGQYDFAFIDADKENYLTYYEQCLTLVRTGGLVVFDNMLWSGRVADPADESETTKAIRAVNEKARTDARVSTSLVPIGDGVLLVRKR